MGKLRERLTVANLLLAFVILVVLFVVVGCVSRIRKGDLNLDGKITMTDVWRAMRLAVALDTPNWLDMYLGDMNSDGKIDSADAGIIMRMVEE